MNIGIVYKSGNSYIALIQIPFMVEQSFLLLQNSQKTKDSAPDFNLMARVGGQLTSVGGVWNKTAGSGTAYKSMTVEHPLAYRGKINFSIFDAKDAKKYKKEDKEYDITHNIVYSAPRAQNNTNDFGAAAPMTKNNAPDVMYSNGDDDEIPF